MYNVSAIQSKHNVPVAWPLYADDIRRCELSEIRNVKGEVVTKRNRMLLKPYSLHAMRSCCLLFVMKSSRHRDRGL